MNSLNYLKNPRQSGNKVSNPFEADINIFKIPQGLESPDKAKETLRMERIRLLEDSVVQDVVSSKIN
ncbi:hypothetical protein [Prochlorococcus sp. MIT 1223]|uniref:hypothetical protein n=1 Tax=Prochlorococcus sp. MIT 1223 TaxID=3096217 RepID=UPI002A75AB8B|nr:hypothetical protein [Prochlorococcus sp. MIT 1223]